MLNFLGRLVVIVVVLVVMWKIAKLSVKIALYVLKLAFLPVIWLCRAIF